jgi:hypothetical protein
MDEQELRGRFKAALAVAQERTGNTAQAEQIMSQLARASGVRWVGVPNLIETYGATGTHGGIAINPAGAAALEKFIAGMHTGVTHGVWRSDWSGGRQAAYLEASRRGATDAQGQEIAMALGDEGEIDRFLSGTHTGVLYGVTAQPQAAVEKSTFVGPLDTRSKGSLEQEMSAILSRLAEQDEQLRIDAANRLAIESQQFQQRLEFDKSRWAEQLGMEELAQSIQAAGEDRRLLESMSTPFASLMGQYQLRAPDQPVTLTPAVGQVLRGAGIPVTGEIEGEPVTLSARDITAGGGQVVRDLMRNIGAREWEGISNDPMEMAQLEVLGAVGGMGRLPLIQGIRNRQINERPLFSSRFAASGIS